MTRSEHFMRPLRVISTTPLAPHMLRLRLAGRDLEIYEDPSELHVRLYVPRLGRHEAVQQTLRGHTGPWPAAMDEDIVARYYTLRRINAREGWLDIDFVLHHPAGPGSSFARHAKPGDICAISAPCGRGARPAQRYLIAGDETALPAIARIAESLPAQACGSFFLELASVQERILFDMPAGMSVHWLYRDGQPAPSSHQLEERVRLELARLPAPDPTLFVWLAGEWNLASRLRPLLATYKPQSICVAYWRAESSKELAT